MSHGSLAPGHSVATGRGWHSRDHVPAGDTGARCPPEAPRQCAPVFLPWAWGGEADLAEARKRARSHQGAHGGKRQEKRAKEAGASFRRCCAQGWPGREVTKMVVRGDLELQDGGGQPPRLEQPHSPESVGYTLADGTVFWDLRGGPVSCLVPISWARTLNPPLWNAVAWAWPGGFTLSESPFP